MQQNGSSSRLSKNNNNNNNKKTIHIYKCYILILRNTSLYNNKQGSSQIFIDTITVIRSSAGKQYVAILYYSCDTRPRFVSRILFISASPTLNVYNNISDTKDIHEYMYEHVPKAIATDAVYNIMYVVPERFPKTLAVFFCSIFIVKSSAHV